MEEDGGKNSTQDERFPAAGIKLARKEGYIEGRMERMKEQSNKRKERGKKRTNEGRKNERKDRGRKEKRN
ncbi:hypothetical protein ILYODFUR_000398 [Ilyodon furcidens]|uniref:Uncharacterized protein n=1 Tax=Ilyodon furcidens TaxID=33524 RepID=A0ABV0V1P8_9TELE